MTTVEQLSPVASAPYVSCSRLSRGHDNAVKLFGDARAFRQKTAGLNHRSHPYTSNDNPFSEALFKTVKYRPEFPDRFGAPEDALSFGRTFFPWYNTEHRHSGIGYLTPDVVHHGQASAVLAARAATLRQAFADHPTRFKHKPPTLPAPPTEVWINPPAERKCGAQSKIGVHSWPVIDAMTSTNPEIGADVPAITPGDHTPTVMTIVLH